MICFELSSLILSQIYLTSFLTSPGWCLGWSGQCLAWWHCLLPALTQHLTTPMHWQTRGVASPCWQYKASPDVPPPDCTMTGNSQQGHTPAWSGLLPLILMTTRYPCLKCIINPLLFQNPTHTHPSRDKWRNVGKYTGPALSKYTKKLNTHH